MRIEMGKKKRIGEQANKVPELKKMGDACVFCSLDGSNSKLAMAMLRYENEISLPANFFIF